MPKIQELDPLEVRGELPQVVFVMDDRLLPKPLLPSEILEETGCTVFERILGLVRPSQPNVPRHHQPEHLSDGIAHALPDFLTLVL